MKASKTRPVKPSFLACDALPRGHVELLGEGVSAQVSTERHAWNITGKRCEDFGAMRGAVRGGGRRGGARGRMGAGFAQNTLKLLPFGPKMEAPQNTLKVMGAGFSISALVLKRRCRLRPPLL